MQYNIFETPVIGSVLRIVSRLYVKLTGWRTVDRRPDKGERFLMIIAPHTSNWDFLNIYMVSVSMGIWGYWLGKHTLFKGPLRPIFRWLGGVPVVRSRSMNLVDQCIKAYADDPKMMLAITPEGTRSRVSTWKTGFYHIAVGAKIPIGLSYLDYRLKEGGIGAMFRPTGDIEKDLPEIRAFYRNITAKHPHDFDPGPPLPSAPIEK
jgi:1-acyl-sn-glycerol-3-phosphate acyltransferase